MVFRIHDVLRLVNETAIHNYTSVYPYNSRHIMEASGCIGVSVPMILNCDVHKGLFKGVIHLGTNEYRMFLQDFGVGFRHSATVSPLNRMVYSVAKFLETRGNQPEIMSYIILIYLEMSGIIFLYKFKYFKSILCVTIGRVSLRNCQVSYDTGLSYFFITISIHGMESQPSANGIATLGLNRWILWFEKPIQFCLCMVWISYLS